jgi:hypothetical protein
VVLSHVHGSGIVGVKGGRPLPVVDPPVELDPEEVVMFASK